MQINQRCREPDRQGELRELGFVEERLRTVDVPAANLYSEFDDRLCEPKVVLGTSNCIGLCCDAKLKCDLRRVVLREVFVIESLRLAADRVDDRWQHGGEFLR